MLLQWGNSRALYIHISIVLWISKLILTTSCHWFLPQLLRGQLTALLEDVPLAFRREMWYIYDGVSAHYLKLVSQYFDVTYCNSWIRPVVWPPDPNHLDCYLWRNLAESSRVQSSCSGCEILFSNFFSNCAATTFIRKPFSSRDSATPCSLG